MVQGLPLGINFTYLLAQFINLAILFLVLHRVFFRRFVSTVEERSARIKKGLEDAQRADRRAEQAEEEYRRRIELAENERQAILNRAAEEAEVLRQDILARARIDARELIAKQQEEFAVQRHLALTELSQEAVDLIILATRKMVGEVTADDATQRRLISESLLEVGRAG